MSDYNFGDMIIARFAPKNLDTLRPCMAPLIGKTFVFEWMGTSNDDEPYPSQARWIIARWHESEIPDECTGRWIPMEDIKLQST